MFEVPFEMIEAGTLKQEKANGSFRTAVFETRSDGSVADDTSFPLPALSDIGHYMRLPMARFSFPFTPFVKIQWNHVEKSE
jgi:hypothetical protein